jgi:hypothetical protein
VTAAYGRIVSQWDVLCKKGSSLLNKFPFVLPKRFVKVHPVRVHKFKGMTVHCPIGRVKTQQQMLFFKNKL